ncbi:hypothetical protein ONZ45_g14819 [Pleurotus djamor]|nr:hypothetical protein ONZ45_g14819 [Pleurotus djamor]
MADTSYNASPTLACSSIPDIGDTHHPELGASKRKLSSLPPDGGREAWSTIVGGFLVQFCAFGYINAFGVYQDHYTREFLSNRTASDISWIGSFQLFVMYALGAIVGHAFDAGYFHHTMIFGSILYVFSMFMLSLAQPHQYYQVFLSQGVGMGIGQGILFLPSLTIVGHHFKRRRALASGIVVSGASVGGVVFPIMLSKIAEHTTFANSIRATAALVAISLFIANLLMKTRPPEKVVDSDAGSSTKVGAAPRPELRTILADWTFIVAVLGAFFTNLGLFFPYFYLQLYAVAHGIAPSMAFYALTILNAGSMFGRLLPNFLADLLGVYNMLIPFIVISAGLIFSLLGIQSFAGIVVFAALYGFSSGAYVSLIAPLLGQLSSHLGELG